MKLFDLFIVMALLNFIVVLVVYQLHGYVSVVLTLTCIFWLAGALFITLKTK